MAHAQQAPGALDPFTASIADLQKLLQSGTSSYELVEAYAAHIATHDSKLHAVAALTPVDIVQSIAKQLDDERAAGNIRGPLHGIPVLIKDNTATSTKYGLDTTAGSLALVGAKSLDDSDLVKHLEAAGAIILGKTTLSELSFWKGYGLRCGWSATAGQAQSAYVRGGVDPHDTFAGHSNPGGSSSGSAISVSAGFAAIAFGTETDGSVVMPANRAGIYAIKPTVGLCSARGIVPFHPLFDTPGVMGKNAVDVGVGLDIIAGNATKGRYATAAANQSWKGLRIGLLDPQLWRQPPTMIKPVQSATEQMIRDINVAYTKLESVIEKLHKDLDWIGPDDAVEAGKSLMPLWKHGFRPAFDAYLQTLHDSPVHNLVELVQFNKEHAAQELPPDNPNQDALLASLDPDVTDAEADRCFKAARKSGREDGIDKALSLYGIDAIIGPADSPITKMGSASGYPMVTLPLSHLDYNGRPFGLVALASGDQDDVLLRVMGAWQATFPDARIAPPLLTQDGQQANKGASL